MNFLAEQKQIHRHREQTFCYQGGESGRDKLEFGITRYRLLYINQINSKVPLYSTGNRLQYPVKSRNGKEKLMTVFIGTNQPCKDKSGVLLDFQNSYTSDYQQAFQGSSIFLSTPQCHVQTESIVQPYAFVLLLALLQCSVKAAVVRVRPLLGAVSQELWLRWS